MAQSTRPRRRSGRNDQGKGKKRPPQQSKQPSRAAKKRKKESDAETVNDSPLKKKKKKALHQEADDEELFKVEKIVDFKLDRNGAPLYKTRWKGYNASDDTWEPGQNVASTGHLDRWERQQRRRTLRKGRPGVAVIEYEDGEREMVSLSIEKFRAYHPDLSDDDDRDDDTVNGDEDVNNFSLVEEGEWIEMLWPHTHIYFPCKIISWAPPRSSKRPQKKNSKSSTEESSVSVTTSVQSQQQKERRSSSSKKSKRRVIHDDVEESSVTNSVQSQQKEAKASPKKVKRLDDSGNQGKRPADDTTAPTNKIELELAQSESAQEMFWRDGSESMHRDCDRVIHKKSAIHKEEEHVDSDDESSSDSDSSGFSRTVEKAGHGIPLFDEPEDDFGSSDADESDSDNDEHHEGYGLHHTHQRPIQSGMPKLSFEEQWMLKLKRTQEMIDKGY